MIIIYKYSLAISITLFESSTPELGRTQYFLGAVVLILNKTFLSEGFINFMYDVTATLKGPANNTFYDF